MSQPYQQLTLNFKNRKLQYIWFILYYIGSLGERHLTYSFALLNTFYPLSSSLPIPLPAPSAPQAFPLEAVLYTVTRLSEKYYLFPNGSVGRT